MNTAASRTWIAAASSIGAVEALKDQLGICRWNHALGSLHQHANNNLRSYCQPKKLLSAASSAAVPNMIKKNKEAHMIEVMDLSCWGPSTTRFLITSNISNQYCNPGTSLQGSL